MVVRRWGIGTVVLAAALSLAGGGLACKRQETGRSVQDAPVHVSVWFHTGQPAERNVIEAQVKEFNARRSDVEVDLTLIPEGAYSAQVQAASLAGDLPDLLELDGPLLARYAWQGLLAPLEPLLPSEIRKDLIPSIVRQGTYRGTLFGVGTFDSGLGLFADGEQLAKARLRIPDGTADAWSATEFTQVLKALAEHDSDGQVLDLKRNYRGEWFTYAFSPVLWSAGADLIDRERLTASGVLDGPRAVAAVSQIQGWRGYVDPNIDDAAFVSGRVALSWVGHWEYPRYREALGERLIVLPLPDFGNGSRTGQGSWQWAITKKAQHPEAAARFLGFLLETEQVLRMAAANGAPPATRTAMVRSPLYGEGGALRLFAAQLEHSAVPRPNTPAYPTVTSAFQQAMADILAGGDVQAALSRAAQLIDRDVADNRGYPEW